MAPERLFTPQEANRTLPLVRRIVADVLSTGAALKRLPASGLTPGEIDEEGRRLTRKLEDLLGEFEAIGCYFKDWNFEVGLVDFPAVIDGRKVLLCWRSDEPAITHFHGYNEGYAGRRELPSESPA